LQYIALETLLHSKHVGASLCGFSTRNKKQPADVMPPPLLVHDLLA